MAFRTNPPQILPGDIHWDAVGQEPDTLTRLLAHIRVCGLDMHLEAREVVYEDDMQTTKEYPDDHDAMCSIADTTFTTIEIGGREYFLFALPYGR